MNAKPLIFPALFLSALAAAPVQAAPGDALTECVELASDHQATRFGSQYLLIRSDDAHYRLGFGGACDAIALTANVQVSTSGTSNRLCPTGTHVETKRDTCKVRSVEEIRADEFERYAKRNRR